MRKIYQLRTSKEMTGRKIQYRNITCACSNCVESNYNSCLTNSAWSTVDLEKQGRRQGRQRQAQIHAAEESDSSMDSVDEEPQHEDREHVNGAIARTQVSCVEAFGSRPERTAAMSQLRTSNRAKRDKNKDS